jgi:hypothetical protein
MLLGMDPVCEAALHAFRDQREAFGEVLAGLPDEALNWRPGPETNSIAVLVEHAWGSTIAWTARAAAREVERDREAEFRVTRGAPELEELLARGLSRIEEHLAAVDPNRYGERHETLDVTRAWCLLHAMEHSREHVGQAQLTRQLWQERRG